MTSQALVKMDGVSKRFGSAIALDHLSLEIKEGEFVTFLGPSGCGKSTTLRILGGFERPDTGRVILSGEDVTHQPPERRHVNMVFQDYALFPHMTVRQNISFSLELKGMGQAAIKQQLDEIMSFLELKDYGDRYPGQLSGGQRQRVALARALAPEPALLLLDEPLAALDAKLRGQVQRELKSIQRQTNKTFSSFSVSPSLPSSVPSHPAPNETKTPHTQISLQFPPPSLSFGGGVMEASVFVTGPPRDQKKSENGSTTRSSRPPSTLISVGAHRATKPHKRILRKNTRRSKPATI